MLFIPLLVLNSIDVILELQVVLANQIVDPDGFIFKQAEKGFHVLDRLILTLDVSL